MGTKCGPPILIDFLSALGNKGTYLQSIFSSKFLQDVFLLKLVNCTRLRVIINVLSSHFPSFFVMHIAPILFSKS